jgi:TM2 domain-containing membrane protein YozV
MLCRNCGKELIGTTDYCPKCGAKAGTAPVAEVDNAQLSGRVQAAGVDNAQSSGRAQGKSSVGKNKIAAGLLGIFLGWLGIHKFYLGYKKEATIMLVISLVGIPLCFIIVGAFMISVISLIGFIEGIIYLTKSDAAFESLYVQGHKGWF